MPSHDPNQRSGNLSEAELIETRLPELAEVHAEKAEVRACAAERARREAEARADETDQALERARIERDQALRERDAILSSTAWKLTYPLRILGHRAPSTLRRAFRGGAKLTWWALTFKVPRKLRERTIRDEFTASSPEMAEFREDGQAPEGRRYRWEYPGALADPEFANWNSCRIRRLRELIPQVAQALSEIPDHPLISVVVPVHDPELAHLECALLSVEEQVYPNWELVIVDDASTDPEIVRFLQSWTETRGNVRLHRLRTSAHIAGATNKAIAEARGEFVLFLDHDDELTPDALLEVARIIAADPAVDVVYSDHDILDDEGTLRSPSFKPGWSPELLLSYMYLGHVKAYRTSLVRAVDGMRGGFEGAADYDLSLRVTEHARSIRHIPNILYHWRAAPRSMARSSSTKPESFESGRRAVEEALMRRGIQARVERPRFAEQMGLGIYRLRFTGGEAVPVTIIIPSKDKAELLRACIDSIEQNTAHQLYNILIVDNESSEPSSVEYLDNTRHEVLRYSNSDGFNFAGIVNAAVASIKTEFFVLLNNDTLVISPEWLEEMLGYANMPGIGAVGAKLLYPDGRIQHAGVVLGTHGLTGHAFQGCADTESPMEYMCFAHVARNYAAVTGACLLSRKSVFNEVGGLDARHLRVAWNDVDYCLRLNERGWRTVFTPYAKLYHLESQSRGDDKNPAEVRYMLQHWRGIIDKDPFFNPNLSRLDQECRVMTDANEERHFYYQEFRCVLTS